MHFKIEPISFQKKSVSLQHNRVDAVREQVTYFRRLNLSSVQAVINPTLNNRFLRKRGMARIPKMEYQVFLCIFRKNPAMATLVLKEMGKFRTTLESVQ